MLRRAAATLLVLVLLAPVAWAIARPHAAACAALDLLPLDPLADGSFADAGLPAVDRQRVIDQRVEVLRRIGTAFGAPQARPKVVHLSATDALWPFSYNGFGSTDFLPGRTCVVLGPDGRDVDVYAHELLHAEIADRVGFWTRWRRIPVWFDEGAAMQVDYRSAFDLPAEAARDGQNRIQDKTTARRFFVDDPEALTDNYAQAKRAVGRWLERIDRRRFYERLDDLRRGLAFDVVWAE